MKIKSTYIKEIDPESEVLSEAKTVKRVNNIKNTIQNLFGSSLEIQNEICIPWSMIIFSSIQVCTQKFV